MTRKKIKEKLENTTLTTPYICLSKDEAELVLYDLNRFEAVKNILWNENLTLGDKMKEIRKSIEVEDYYKYFIDRE